MSETNTGCNADELESGHPSRDRIIDAAVRERRERSRQRRDDLQNLARRDGGQRCKAENHHHRHRKERPAGAGESRTESGYRSHGSQNGNVARAVTIAHGALRVARRHENINTGADDDRRDGDRECPRWNVHCGCASEVTEQHRTDADRHGEAPADRAAPREQPRTEQAGEQEGEKRSRRRRVNTEIAKNGKKRNQQHAADADRADEQPDDYRDCRKCDKGSYRKNFYAQPAAKLVSSLVSNIVSRFITA